MSNCVPLYHVAATRPGATARLRARTSLVDAAHVQLVVAARRHRGVRGQTGDVADDGIAGATIAIRPVTLRRRVQAGEHRAREADCGTTAVAALCTFSRPPDATIPDHAGTTSTFCINVTFSASTLKRRIKRGQQRGGAGHMRRGHARA